MTDVIFYTAIFGDYDTPPEVEPIQADIQYLCFTDSADAKESPPWRRVLVPRMFSDNKLNTNFIKTNAQLLFRWDSVVVWVDANMTITGLDRQAVLDLVSDVGVAAPPHRERSTVSAEAEEVVRLGLDHRLRVVRFLQELEHLGYPDDRGLAANMYLVRDLRRPAVRAANRTWWDSVFRGSRRDQLSLPPALWLHGLDWRPLDVNWWEANRLFTRHAHAQEAGRVIARHAEANQPGVFEGSFGGHIELPDVPSDYPMPAVWHDERWAQDTLAVLRQVNEVVAESGEELEGNYCHFDRVQVSAFTPPDIRRSWKREFLRRAIAPARKGLEIGFNAGHSAAIMLGANPNLHLTCVDIGSHRYASGCADRVYATFGDRLQMIWGDSRAMLAQSNSTLRGKDLDFVHVDGSHEPSAINADLAWFISEARDGCRLMMDDAYVPWIKRALSRLVSRRLITEMHPGLPSTGENRLFSKLTTAPQSVVQSLLDA